MLEISKTYENLSIKPQLLGLAVASFSKDRQAHIGLTSSGIGLENAWVDPAIAPVAYVGTYSGTIHTYCSAFNYTDPITITIYQTGLVDLPWSRQGSLLDGLVQGSGTIINTAIKVYSQSRGYLTIPYTAHTNGKTITASGNSGDIISKLDLKLTSGASVVGGSSNDRLVGGFGSDSITGNAGNDSLYGGEGNDNINGGDGNDWLEGGIGNDALQGNGGDDSLLGDVGNDTLQGNGGNDSLLGYVGNDVLDGGDGVDYAQYWNATARVVVNLGLTVAQDTQGAGLDRLVNIENVNGSSFNDILVGNSSSNWLLGGAGNDSLNGGLGNDFLKGGAGQDAFVFNTALGISNKDVLTDFSVADDTIRLENSIFTALTSTGTLASTAFKIIGNGNTVDGDDHLLYNTATGGISYDADGNGVAASVLVAIVGKSLAMTAADFLVI